MGLINILKGEQPLSYTLAIAAEASVLGEADAGDKGLDGEYLAAYALEHGSIPGNKKIWRNVLVPRKGPTSASEIDVLMLHERGVYVLESKNYSGWIFGSAEQREWTASLNAQTKERFYNPILQNKGHIRALAKELRLEPDMFISVIVFSERCELKRIPQSGNDVLIIQRQHLVRAINASLNARATAFDSERFKVLYHRIDALAKASNSEAQQDHVAEAQQVAAGKICPLCGRDLMERHRRSDGKTFIGCSGYPACRYTRNEW